MFTKICFKRLLFIPKPFLSFTNTFSNNTVKNSQQQIQQFQKLMKQSTQESLTKAAKMMGYLQGQIERNQSQIAQLQYQFQNSPPNIQKIVTMVQKLNLNIQAQKSQILSINSRVQKQLKDCTDFSMSKIAKQFLQVADSLQKCYRLSIQIYGKQYHQAVETIKQAKLKLIKIFQIYGIYQFNPVGEKYNPNRQQALLTIPLEEGKQSNTVAYTIRTGYMIKGRLLRSAHVGVYQ